MPLPGKCSVNSTRSLATKHGHARRIGANVATGQESLLRGPRETQAAELRRKLPARSNQHRHNQQHQCFRFCHKWADVANIADITDIVGVGGVADIAHIDKFVFTAGAGKPWSCSIADIAGKGALCFPAYISLASRQRHAFGRHLPSQHWL